MRTHRLRSTHTHRHKHIGRYTKSIILCTIVPIEYRVQTQYGHSVKWFGYRGDGEKRSHPKMETARGMCLRVRRVVVWYTYAARSLLSLTRSLSLFLSFPHHNKTGKYLLHVKCVRRDLCQQDARARRSRTRAYHGRSGHRPQQLSAGGQHISGRYYLFIVVLQEIFRYLVFVAVGRLERYIHVRLGIFGKFVPKRR